MTEPWCELYDMPSLGCAHCRGNNRTVEERHEAENRVLRAKLLATDPRWFPSTWPSVCGKCGTDFPAEALIRRAHSGIDLLPPDAWVAECCS